MPLVPSTLWGEGRREPRSGERGVRGLRAALLEKFVFYGAALPFPLWGEGRRERSERGVRGLRAGLSFSVRKFLRRQRRIQMRRKRADA